MHSGRQPLLLLKKISCSRTGKEDTDEAAERGSTMERSSKTCRRNRSKILNVEQELKRLRHAKKAFESESQVVHNQNLKDKKLLIVSWNK